MAGKGKGKWKTMKGPGKDSENEMKVKKGEVGTVMEGQSGRKGKCEWKWRRKGRKRTGQDSEGPWR